jgi:hypothetical protein
LIAPKTICHEISVETAPATEGFGTHADENHDVYMTPDGRVEGDDQATTNALECAKSILRQPEMTKNGLK